MFKKKEQQQFEDEYHEIPQQRKRNLNEKLSNKQNKLERSIDNKKHELNQAIRKTSSYQKIQKINYKTTNQNFYDSDTIKTLKSKSNSSQPQDQLNSSQVKQSFAKKTEIKNLE